MTANLVDQPARLIGLGTAVPPYELPQDLVRVTARRLLAHRFPDFDRLAKAFTNAGIDKRYSVAPLDWFEQTRDWPERTNRFVEGATTLFAAAAGRALEAAQLRPEDVDTIVTVSSTGIATPTLEARAMQHMTFRNDVQRVPIFGLGCAGGVTGLAVAARLAAQQPGSKVLLVCVEACTLSFRTDRLRKADIIATVLFGDGAAAALLSTNGTGPAIGTGEERTWRGTLPMMGWNVDPDGFGVVFDRSIPDFVKSHLASAIGGAVRRLGISEITRMVCHPGGAKVVEAIESTLRLDPGSLDHEREVLRDYGNMSSPTVLFVLQRVLEGVKRGSLLLSALGPGFTASLLPIKVGA